MRSDQIFGMFFGKCRHAAPFWSLGIARVYLPPHENTKERGRRQGTSRREAPARDLLRVGPHQIAHRAVVRHLLLAVDGADLVERVDGRAQAPVDAEDAVVDDGRQAQEVEDLRAVLPDVHGTVLSQALVVEAVDLRDLAALVVAADQRDALRVANLQISLLIKPYLKR